VGHFADALPELPGRAGRTPIGDPFPGEVCASQQTGMPASDHPANVAAACRRLVLQSCNGAHLVVAQVLYNYPPDKPPDQNIVSFCFPHGVQPTLLERTPSMSALNELVYSQQYANDDAVSFVFLLKV
jgi:uDENN domain